jgi:hypothetical protein
VGLFLKVGCENRIDKCVLCVCVMDGHETGVIWMDRLLFRCWEYMKDATVTG